MIRNATNSLIFPERIASDSFPRARVSPKRRAQEMKQVSQELVSNAYNKSNNLRAEKQSL